MCENMEVAIIHPIHWARKELNLTMRQVQQRGGPAPSYQSEVENGNKQNPQPDATVRWMKALDVTERFVLGEIFNYHDHPEKCRGLAADVASRIRSDQSLKILGALARFRTVLRIICWESQHITRVVAAYIFGVKLATLDDMLAGTIPYQAEWLQILADLTTLPEMFFRHGAFPEEIEEYVPLIIKLQKQGLSPDQVAERLDRSGQPARPHHEGEDRRAPRLDEL